MALFKKLQEEIEIKKIVKQPLTREELNDIETEMIFGEPTELFEEVSNILIKGGKADKLSVEDIAKKHKVSVEKINSELEKGIKVEAEHVGKDKAKAREISMDHLAEFPDYYTRLDKMEEDAKKDLKEGVIKQVVKTVTAEIAPPSDVVSARKYISNNDGKALSVDQRKQLDKAKLIVKKWKESLKESIAADKKIAAPKAQVRKIVFWFLMFGILGALVSSLVLSSKFNKFYDVMSRLKSTDEEFAKAYVSIEHRLAVKKSLSKEDKETLKDDIRIARSKLRNALKDEKVLIQQAKEEMRQQRKLKLINEEVADIFEQELITLYEEIFIEEENIKETTVVSATGEPIPIRQVMDYINPDGSVTEEGRKAEKEGKIKIKESSMAGIAGVINPNSKGPFFDREGSTEAEDIDTTEIEKTNK